MGWPYSPTWQLPKWRCGAGSKDLRGRRPVPAGFCADAEPRHKGGYSQAPPSPSLPLAVNHNPALSLSLWGDNALLSPLRKPSLPHNAGVGGRGCILAGRSRTEEILGTGLPPRELRRPGPPVQCPSSPGTQWTRGILAAERGGGEAERANGDWGFLLFKKKRKRYVNISKYRQLWRGRVHFLEQAVAGPGVKGQMRPAAFSCTLYSLFFFTRQLMNKSSSTPSAL